VETRQDDSVGALRGLTQRWTRRYGDTRMTGYTHPVEIGEA
jgi:hypothetical protein